MSPSAERVRLCLSSVSLMLAIGSIAPAQRVTVQPALATPGQQVTATVFNDTGVTLTYSSGHSALQSCTLRVLLHSGELASHPVVPGQLCDLLLALYPGQSVQLPLVAPTEPGSYTVVFVRGPRGAARLDVLAPTRNAQSISFYPSRIQWPQQAHQVDFLAPQNTPWELANVGPDTHTFASGDRIELYSPGTTRLAAMLDLAGVSVAPGKVTPVTLPLSGLPPGPYGLRAVYRDPGTGGAVVTRSGIQVLGSRVDLHVQSEHDLMPGRSMRMAVCLTDFPPPGYGAVPYYAVMVGFLPGTTPLPGGIELPLFLDGLAVASITTQLGGLLTNNVGQVPNEHGVSTLFYEGATGGIALAHPNVPALTGLVLRLAAVGVDAAGSVWGSSQPEEFVLR